MSKICLPVGFEFTLSFSVLIMATQDQSSPNSSVVLTVTVEGTQLDIRTASREQSDALRTALIRAFGLISLSPSDLHYFSFRRNSASLSNARDCKHRIAWPQSSTHATEVPFKRRYGRPWSGAMAGSISSMLSTVPSVVSLQITSNSPTPWRFIC